MQESRIKCGIPGGIKFSSQVGKVGSHHLRRDPAIPTWDPGWDCRDPTYIPPDILPGQSVCEPLNSENVLWKSDEEGNWFHWSLGSCSAGGCWALSGPVVQNREFWHKPNIVNYFNCLWSDLKKELWEQLKFLADLLNSVILCKHLWLNWSVPLLHTKIIECSSEIKEKLIQFTASFLNM